MSYTENLQDGIAYEIHVCDAMRWKRRAEWWWQLRFGDTDCKKEIKIDRKFRETGNLYIETSEAPKVGGRWHLCSTFVGAHFLVQGDYGGFWILEAGILRQWRLMALKAGQFRIIKKARSEGFLLPVKQATRFGSTYKLRRA